MPYETEPPLIYIAGPLGGVGRCEAGEQHERVRRALAVAERVYSAGALPFVPHLFWYWATMGPTALDRDDWVAMDQAYLERSDALIRVWGPSPGAVVEVAYMRQQNRRVLELSVGFDPCVHEHDALIEGFVRSIG